MKRFLLLLAGFACVVGVNLAEAVRVTSLYHAVVPVQSQSAEERNQALPQGLGQVLVKVSGNTQILLNPNIKSRINSPESLMQAFLYLPNTKTFLLQLNFDPEGINQLLRDAGVPIWGQNRPLILVWMVNQQDKLPPEIVDNDGGNIISSSLKQAAELRGLPVIFPMMDVTDLGQVTVADIQAQTMPKLANAGKRYASDAMLVGQITQNATGYQVAWKLVLGEQQWNGTSTGKTLTDVFTSVSDSAAAALMARYATVMTDNAGTQVTLKISGVKEADDFSLLMQYLSALTPVVDVQPIRIAANEVVLNISLRSTQQSFAQAVALGQKLQPVAKGSEGNTLVYQWSR